MFAGKILKMEKLRNQVILIFLLLFFIDATKQKMPNNRDIP